MTTYFLRKFDDEFRSKFEHDRANSQKVPTIQEHLNLIEKECTQLEGANLSHVPHKSSLIQKVILSNASTTKPPRGFFSQRTALLTSSFQQFDLHFLFFS